MLLGLDISTDEQFPDKDAGQDGQEIAYVERHDCQHTILREEEWGVSG